MIETFDCKAKFLELKPYCHHSKDDAFMEMVEWHNGEGFDILVQNKDTKERISLTWGQWDALLTLVSYKENSNE